jgi:hypothetical protein
MSRRDRANRKTDRTADLSDLYDPDLGYTPHGHMRRWQRCKKADTFRLFFKHFDRDIYVNRGVCALSLTDRRIEALVDDGEVSRADAERLVGLVVLVGDNDNRIRSVIRGDNGRLGKYLKRWS